MSNKIICRWPNGEARSIFYPATDKETRPGWRYVYWQERMGAPPYPVKLPAYSESINMREEVPVVWLEREAVR